MMRDASQDDDLQESHAARLTAYVLGESDPAEQAEMEVELAADPQVRQLHADLQRISTALQAGAAQADTNEPADSALRDAVVTQLELVELASRDDAAPHHGVGRRRWISVLVAAACLALIAIPLRAIVWRPSTPGQPTLIAARSEQPQELRLQVIDATEQAADEETVHVEMQQVIEEVQPDPLLVVTDDLATEIAPFSKQVVAESLHQDRDQPLAVKAAPSVSPQRVKVLQSDSVHYIPAGEKQLSTPAIAAAAESKSPESRTAVTAPSTGPARGATVASPDNRGGMAAGGIAGESYATDNMSFGFPMPGGQGAPDVESAAKGQGIRFGMPASKQLIAEAKATPVLGSPPVVASADQSRFEAIPAAQGLQKHSTQNLSQLATLGDEQYAPIVENPFVAVADKPLSTFSIDVDSASYSNVRRFLQQNQWPPANAVRLEEFVNYFAYDYLQPAEGEPFSVNLEVAECPWQPLHRLVRIGLRGRDIPRQERPPSNLVFLLDVSGSMQDQNKLPLLQHSMNMLVGELTENDRVTIVTYAGEAGLKLDTTGGHDHPRLREAINSLQANGSTNGSDGNRLAYEKAASAFIPGGANRVILATDGDLNVGITDDDALVQLITEQAKSNVFLTVLGFGQGNLKDGKLEKLADNGNGMYAYIDSAREARRVLVEQVTGSLITIAKDVKIKVEFNPAEVSGYRLLGYENRLLTAPQFNDDRKDAGDIGAGHTVTALYEVVPANPSTPVATDAPALKYQRPVAPVEPPQELTPAAQSGELLTLFLRYKQPNEDESALREFALANQQQAFDDASLDFRFAAAVASFGMVLRNSQYRGHSSLANVESITSSAVGKDPQNYRTDFLDLIRKAKSLAPSGR